MLDRGDPFVVEVVKYARIDAGPVVDRHTVSPQGRRGLEVHYTSQPLFRVTLHITVHSPRYPKAIAAGAKRNRLPSRRLTSPLAHPILMPGFPRKDALRLKR